MDSEFDLAKENVRPLMNGRKYDYLNTALEADHISEMFQDLLKDRQKHEIAIRTYDGEDPLQPWCEYISWIEQTFPKCGREGHLPVVLEKCLEQFKDHEQYKQDIRFVKLWIKFIEMQLNPKEGYQIVYGHGIGTSCALFYRCWAYEFEKEQDFKHADMIYLKGLEHKAEPLEELQMAYSNFQFILSRVALGYEIPTIPPPFEEERHVLSSLHRPLSKKSKPLVARTGDAVLQRAPGTLRPLQQTSHNTNSFQRNEMQFRPFEENVDQPDMGIHKAVMKAIPRRHVENKENTVNPGPWNKPHRKQKQSYNSVSQSNVHHKAVAPFPIHTDESNDYVPASRSRDVFDVLKTRKNEMSKDSPLFVFEPPDPTKRVMYCKNKVYSGGVEFSLEELRALKYFEMGRLKKLGQVKRENNELVHQTRRQPDIIGSACEIIESSGEASNFMLKSSIFSGLANSNSSLNKQEKSTFQLMSNDNEVPSRESQQNFISSELVQLVADNKTNSLTNQNNREIQFNGSNISKPHLIASDSYANNTPSCYIDDRENKSTWSVVKGSMSSTESVGKDSSISKIAPPPARESSNKLTSVNKYGFLTKENHSKEYPNMGNQLRVGALDICNQSALPAVSDQSLTVNTKEAMEAINDMWRSKISGSELWQSSDNLPQDENKHDLNSQSGASSEKKGIPFQIYTDESVVEGVLPGHTREENAGKLTQAKVTSPSNKENEFNILVDTDDEDAPEIHESPYADPNVPPLDALIPFCPAPEMTQEEINNLGSSDKENDTNDYDEMKYENCKKKYRRELNGILQPSKNIPFLPLDQQELYVDDFDNGGDQDCRVHDDKPVSRRIFEDTTDCGNRDLYEETCNTQAFALPLPSSTPFTNHFRKLVPEELYQDSRNKQNSICTTATSQNTEQHQEIKRTESLAVPTQQNYYSDVRGDNLSTIMENSKEYKSSSSSGSSAAMTTRRTTFSSQWTHTKESLRIVPEEAESFQRMSDSSSKCADERKTQNLSNTNQAPCTVIPESKNSNNNVYMNGNAANFHCKTNEDSHLPQPGNFSLQHELLKNTSQINTNCNEEWWDEYSEVVKRIEALNVNDSDPFDEEIQNTFLRAIDFPQPRHMLGYTAFDSALPRVRAGANLTLGNDKIVISHLIGSGAYSKVYEAVISNRKQKLALKVQSSLGNWEYYISREIQIRLKDPSKATAFLYFERAYIYRNGSILISPLIPFGTLLTVINTVKERKGIKLNHLVAMYWTYEVLCIVKELMNCNIIHGDVKPDNFLLQRIPTIGSSEPSIQLIDFGRSIDMNMYPRGKTFKKVVTTDGFQCIEMKNKQPWTYQTDLFGVVGTGHCLLFGEYMKLIKTSNNKWMCSSNFPRYVHRSVWETFFLTLLNIESCEKLPNLDNLETLFREVLTRESIELSKQLSFTKAVLSTK